MKEQIKRFFEAVIAEDDQALADLVASGFDINMNIPDISGDEEPALLTYVYEGNIDAVRFLLAHRANVNVVRAGDGSSALNVAGVVGRSDIALLLLEHDINPNTFNEYGISPLHEFAEISGMVGAAGAAVAVVEALLAHGSSTTQTNIAGLTPFQVACAEGATSAVRIIMHAMQTRGENIFGDKDLSIIESFRESNPELYHSLVFIYNAEKRITFKEPTCNELKKGPDDNDGDDDIADEKGDFSKYPKDDAKVSQGESCNSGSSGAKDCSDLKDNNAIINEDMLPFIPVAIAASIIFTNSLEILDSSYIGSSSLPALDLSFCFDYIAL